MKKLILVLLALAGVGLALKVVRDQRDKAQLWAEITDQIPAE
ncbi:MAG: DLW-39 family protein [Propionibacteriaceae bacterium]|jgi:hypothetical protein|nr:DLW-39 family protein [Propionibacteriaceae bacterium]